MDASTRTEIRRKTSSYAWRMSGTIIIALVVMLTLTALRAVGL